MLASLRRAALPLVLAAPALLGAQAAERFTLSGPEVAVYDLAGRLRVVPGSGRDVVVEVARQGRDAGVLRVRTGDVRGRPTLAVTTDEDRLVYPELGRWQHVRNRVRDDGTWGDDRGSLFGRGHTLEIRGSGGGPEAWADVTVSVPAGQRVAVHLLAGEAIVRNVSGDLVVDVAAAKVTTEGTRGRLLVDAGAGTVRVQDAEGDVDIDAGSGSVELDNVRATRLRVDGGSGALRGSEIDAAALDLDLGSGATRLAGVRTRTMKLDTGSGSVDVGFVAPIDDVRIDSGSGAVTLRLPPSLGATVDIDTGSGGIESEVPITISRRERDHLTGRIGDGKGRIVIDAGSGRVRLLKS